MMKSSKYSLLFAQEHNIERFKGSSKVNPIDFTPDELQAFETFKQQKKQEREHADYEKRKIEGRAPKTVPRAELSEEQLQHRRDLGRKKALLRNYRMRYPDKSREEIDDMVQRYIDDHPRGENGQMKTGPKRGSTMMPKKRKADNSVEAQVQESGPRPKGKPSGIDYLTMFLNENPDIPKVNRPVDLEPETKRAYERFRTNYNTRVRYREDPEAMRQKRREQRMQDPERFRATEARYRANVSGRSTGTTQARPEPVYVTHEEWLNSVQYRWDLVKSSARQKGRELELTMEDVAALCEMPCYYCGTDPKEIGTRFGIDRVDNAVGYTRANSVACCTPCNFAKKDYHLHDFLRGMCNVGHALCPEEDRDDNYQVTYNFLQHNANKKPADFSGYRYGAHMRSLEFNITLQEFDKMVRAPCYYCGRDDHVMGLDRVDNGSGYDEHNCVACCSMCNSLKGDRDLDVFLCQVFSIYKYWHAKVPN